MLNPPLPFQGGELYAADYHPPAPFKGGLWLKLCEQRLPLAGAGLQPVSHYNVRFAMLGQRSKIAGHERGRSRHNEEVYQDETALTLKKDFPKGVIPLLGGAGVGCKYKPPN